MRGDIIMPASRNGRGIRANWHWCLCFDPLRRLLSVSQHPPKLGIATTMLIEQLLAGLDDAPP